MKTTVRAVTASLVFVGALASTDGESWAQAPAPSVTADGKSWDERYDDAYTALSEGRLREASSRFHALARSARSDQERTVAHELGRLASERADQEEAAAAKAAAAANIRPIRSTDELTLLYASGFLYGAGSGVWFLLATEPNSALTATLPFAALTAAPAIAIASIDSLRPLARGVPHAISAGLYVGLGESIWVVGRQQARARRFRATDPASDATFRPETVTAVLWTGATLGGILGGALGAGLETTPGRVSFTASTTLWAGVLSGLTSGALMPNDDRRSERAFTIGGVGYNAGLAGGLFFAARVSPSVARVRLADLFAVAGGLVTTGGYLSLSRDVDVRAAEGLAAGGIATGLALGWLVTQGMTPDLGPSPRRPVSLASTVQPSFLPVPGGAGVGVFGAF